MSQAESLYQLQLLELKMLQNRKRLQEITKALADDVSIQQARTQVQNAKEHLSPLQARSRNLDLEIQSTVEKANIAEENLYSGKIKNPKELTDLQNEIQSLRKRHSELESTLLETLFAVEEAEATLAEAEAELAKVTAQWEQDHSQLITERDACKAEFDRARAEREKALTKINPESLKIYDKLKQSKHNQPVAQMTGNTCGICGVGQNMAIERDVRQGQKLVFCSNCERILIKAR